jgi:2-pyrone-4,6-dicarboxylate lactonase
MRENPLVWTKVTCPDRLTATGPPYDDVVPFARAVVRDFPHRVLWGTDWPHPNLKSHMPDDGELVDIVPRIAPDGTAQQRLLVDNPMRLYWESEASRGHAVPD